MKHPGRRILVVALSVAALGATSATADTIRVQSTTDTIDAGLKDDVLIPGYAAVQPGDTLNYVGVGTGKALDNARSGIADVVITHAPSLEKKFQDDGFSLEGPGRAIFYSDYVIVGPKTDPAGVKTAANHDAVTAFEKIAAANATGGPKASFISRGDNSGTNVQEQLMWHLTGDTVAKQKASNAGTATDRDEPGTGGAYPTWYRKTNVGQAASLLKTAACSSTDAPDGNCYTIVDRGTFNREESKGTLGNLAVLSENNDASARGGKDLLINPFSAYIVKQDNLPAGSPTVNVAAAQRFLDYLTSPAFQAKVDTYPNTTNPAFRGDAFPAIGVDTALPPTATTGTTVPLALTLRNKVPGTTAPAGNPVQLQSSTDNGATWTNVGAPVATDAAGRVSFAPTVTATARYRVSTGRFLASTYNTFSPSVQDVGSVTAVAPVVPGTTIPTVPTVPTKPVTKPKDRKAPTASRARLTRKRLTLRLSEAGSVRVTISRKTVKRVRRNGRLRSVVTYRRVKTVSGRVKKAGTVTLKLPTLRKATYRISIRSTDLAGNKRTQTRTLKLR